MILDKNHTRDHLFLFFMHRFAETFHEKAILKGGMMLRLLNCPRSTMDLDYIFSPFASKKEIFNTLMEIAAEVPGAKITHSMNSKMLQIFVKTERAEIQIEASVQKDCKSTEITTQAIADGLSELSRVIKIMNYDVAFANKLSAWNERRLKRDLYDIYFYYKFIGAKPDMQILHQRFENFSSQLPKLKQIKKMDLVTFKHAIEDELQSLTRKNIEDEIKGLLPPQEFIGLDIKMKVGIREMIEKYFN